MTDNPFARAATARPQYLVRLREDRARYDEAASDPRLCGREQAWYARYWWSGTAAIAHYLVHDQALADIHAAIPHDSHAGLQNLFVTIARSAQEQDEPPISARTLLQGGLLPTDCRLTAFGVQRLATLLYGALEQGSSEDAHEAMYNLAEFCGFAPDTVAVRDTPPNAP